MNLKMTCFHMLKIFRDGDFYMLFGENYKPAASAKFDRYEMLQNTIDQSLFSLLR